MKRRTLLKILPATVSVGKIAQEVIKEAPDVVIERTEASSEKPIRRIITFNPITKKPYNYVSKEMFEELEKELFICVWKPHNW